MERVTKTQRYKKKLAILQQVKMRQKLLKSLSKLLRTKKVTLYG